MKKHVLTALILVWMSSTASAQTAIARLKYEDAEMAYTRKDYKSALVFLKEAEELLKSSNPKLLHLKILAMSNLVKNEPFLYDPEYVAEVRKDCDYYLKTYEEVPNNEDKYREVYDVSKVMVGYDIYGETLKNAIKGDPLSQDTLGRVYNMRKRTDRSLYWFNKAIAGGNINAMNNLGNVYYSAKDDEKAIKYHELAANKGNDDSMWTLGILYRKAKNNEKAIYWYSKAVDAGHLLASVSLGDFYLEGDGVPQSDTQALACYNRAISQTPKNKSDSTRLASAYYDLMTLHYYGDNIAKDYKKVEEYANKCILLNDSDTRLGSMIHLADIYRTGGYGIQQDYTKAFNYYSSVIKIEEGGKGCYGMAMLYKNGLGVKKDKSKAQEYTQKAIMLLDKGSKGNRGYLVKLEELYREGILVDTDPKKADEYKAQIDAILAKKSKN